MNDVEKIRQAAWANRRSAVYRWMDANFETFKATVDGAGKPNWRELARVFGELGLLDRAGKVPTAEGTRQTWFQVRKNRKTKPAERAAVRPPGEIFPSEATMPLEPPAEDEFQITDITGRPIKP
jgi:hypothetical protein